MWELRLSYRAWSQIIDKGGDFAAVKDWFSSTQDIVAGRFYRVPGPDRGLRRDEWKSLNRIRRRDQTPSLYGVITGREVLFMVLR